MAVPAKRALVRKQRPQKRQRVSDTLPESYSRPCNCNRPADQSWTLTCEKCNSWLHGDCINFPEEYKDLIKEAICKSCQKRTRRKTKFFPKCRLDGCFRGVRDPASEYCSPEHRAEFWKVALAKLEDPEAVQTLDWLAGKYDDADFAKFMYATAELLPETQMSPNTDLEKRAALFENALKLREETNTCGFDPRLIGIEDPVCDGPYVKCHQHTGWTQMMSRKLELERKPLKSRELPDQQYITKRAKYLVTGITRVARSRTRKAGYIIPYVWEDGNEDYFLEDNPELFWDRHF